MGNNLKVSAVAISSKGKGMNLDNIYVNGRYLAPESGEPQVCISKTSSVDFQMYGVCDGENTEDVSLKSSPSVMVMQRMQQLQSVLSADGAISRDKIWSFLCETNQKVREYQTTVGSEGVTSTFAGLFLNKNRGLAVHMGDSRIYVIRNGRMLQITEDHLEAMELRRFGVLTEEQAEVHKLNSRPTATLGMFDIYDVESQVFSKYFVFYPGDIFILCTDGVTDAVTNQEIERVIRQYAGEPREAVARKLIDMAAEKNDDDKSIIVLTVEDTGADTQPQAPAKKSAAKKAETAAPAGAKEGEAEKPAKKAGIGASLAAFASRIDGSSENKNEPAPVQEKPAEETEEQEEKASKGFLGGLAGKFRKKEEPEAADETAAPAPVKEKPAAEPGAEDDTEAEDEEEMTILDRIFGNPRLILTILAGLVVFILLIILISSMAKGCSRPNGGNSAASGTQVNSTVDPGTSKSDSGSGSTSKSDSAAAGNESSAGQNSSKEETSKNESSKEESSQEESSAAVATYTVVEGDTYYGILLKYYDEFSDELLDAFCKYNNSDPTILHIGDVLKIPVRSELENVQ